MNLAGTNAVKTRQTERPLQPLETGEGNGPLAASSSGPRKTRSCIFRAATSAAGYGWALSKSSMRLADFLPLAGLKNPLSLQRCSPLKTGWDVARLAACFPCAKFWFQSPGTNKKNGHGGTCLQSPTLGSWRQEDQKLSSKQQVGGVHETLLKK